MRIFHWTPDAKPQPADSVARIAARCHPAQPGPRLAYVAQMTLDVQLANEMFSALQRHFDTTQIVELASASATLQSGGATEEMIEEFERTQARYGGEISDSEGYEVSADYVAQNGTLQTLVFAEPFRSKPIDVPKQALYLEDLVDSTLKNPLGLRQQSRR